MDHGALTPFIIRRPGERAGGTIDQLETFPQEQHAQWITGETGPPCQYWSLGVSALSLCFFSVFMLFDFRARRVGL